jgi:hypothetical protein
MTIPPRTTAQILDQQKKDTERLRQQQAATARMKPVANPQPPAFAAAGNGRAPAPSASTAVATAAPSAVAVPDERDSVSTYLDEIAPGSIVGRMVKFSKDGRFVFHDDDSDVPEDAEFVACCDQTLIGWIKFNKDGAPPDRHMGLLYANFRMPPRDSLGDTDESQWEPGLSGMPADPWQHQVYLVLQRTGTSEFATFVTSSRTGRRAVGNLLRHYERTTKAHPDELPVVRLRAGGFNHKDERIGWVPTPVFVVVGRAERDASMVPPDTSPSGHLDDAIPFVLAAVAAIPLLGLLSAAGGLFA